MLTYGDFYDIAKYGNENWKGGFTEKEVADNAYEYLCAFQESKEKPKVNYIMQDLLQTLDEDNCEESSYYADMIRYELGLL